MSYPTDIIEALSDMITHPIETLQSAAYAGAQFVQNHPYAFVTILGLGALAMHNRNLRFDNNNVHVRFKFDTPLGACDWNTTHRIGPKL